MRSVSAKSPPLRLSLRSTTRRPSNPLRHLQRDHVMPASFAAASPHQCSYDSCFAPARQGIAGLPTLLSRWCCPTQPALLSVCDGAAAFSATAVLPLCRAVCVSCTGGRASVLHGRCPFHGLREAEGAALWRRRGPLLCQALPECLHSSVRLAQVVRRQEVGAFRNCLHGQARLTPVQQVVTYTADERQSMLGCH